MTASLTSRLRQIDWREIHSGLAEWGHARTGAVLAPSECAALRARFDDDGAFRSRVHMEQHRFGVGDYAYFERPLPEVVQALREELYAGLASIANEWMKLLGRETRYPPDLERFLARCRRAGQSRPTPLLLRYTSGGYNCLHQDLYGEVAFPLQVAINLSRRGVDYEGGELLLVEQRPRAQSRGEAIAAEQGELVIFPTADRPVHGKRGVVRYTMRHGASRILRGERHVLGIIFHDAR